MYISLDADRPGLAFAALASAIAAPDADPCFLILDGESVVIASLSGLVDAYPDEPGIVSTIVLQASGRHTASPFGVDAVLDPRRDPGEAARWLSIWLDPELA